MKVLTDDRQISIAATASPLSASFALANVNTDRPRQEYIADASTDTITVSCAADAANAVDAIFISGTMFDSATYTLKDTGGSTVETSSFTASDITSSNNNGNANTLNTFYKNQSRVQYPEFVSFTNAQTANCSVDLALSSTTDRKALQIEGNAIASWDQNSGATGRFLDSASNAINLENHGQIYVGSLISTIDSSINNPTDGNNYTITAAPVLEHRLPLRPATRSQSAAAERLQIHRVVTKPSARILQRLHPIPLQQAIRLPLIQGSQ